MRQAKLLFAALLLKGTLWGWATTVRVKNAGLSARVPQCSAPSARLRPRLSLLEQGSSWSLTSSERTGTRVYTTWSCSCWGSSPTVECLSLGCLRLRGGLGPLAQEEWASNFSDGSVHQGSCQTTLLLYRFQPHKSIHSQSPTSIKVPAIRLRRLHPNQGEDRIAFRLPALSSSFVDSSVPTTGSV